MKDFDKICKDFENIDIDTYAAVLTEKARKNICRFKEVDMLFSKS